MTAAGVEARDTCLRLARAAAYDPGLLQRLHKSFGGIDAAVGQPWQRLQRHVRRPPAGVAAPAAGDPSWAAPRGDPGRAVVTWVDPEYPERLRAVYDAPTALYVAGADWRRTLEALEGPAVAVVGARGPSPYGLEMTALIAGELARRGVSVVSGLALGIDAAAHREALAALPSDGAATVAAVLGCGVDVVHPRANRELFAEVRRRGVIIGEYGWDLPGLAWRFPARNRIIAGLADAVVIVEGSARSGSLHTAAYMLELGREVLAVPGEAGRRLSAGPHLLLRDGARLCESAADVCEAIGLPSAAAAAAGSSDRVEDGAPNAEARSEAGDPLEARVLERLATGRHTVDQLVGALGREARSVVAVLTMLELEGAIEADEAGAWRMPRAPARPRYDRAGARGEKEAVPGPAKQDQ